MTDKDIGEGEREEERRRERKIDREEVTGTCKEKGGHLYLPKWLLL